MSSVWSKEIFAKNLKYYMDKSGKNQKEMAVIAGVSTPTFSDWINAKKYPRIDKIEKLANYFGILKSDLIEEKKPATNDELERELISLFRLVPEESRPLVLSMIKAAVKNL